MNRPLSFFKKIVLNKETCTPDRLIVVTHLAPGNEDFLLELNERIPIAAVIPKPNSIDTHTRDIVSSRIQILNWNRATIKSQPNQFTEEIESLVEDASFAIIDTGGYFSHVLRQMCNRFEAQFLGVVEDTENGHQKYTALLTEDNSNFPCPIISVARSSLKDPEDFLVGQAIIFSSEALLRARGEILNSKNAVVFGYGKIGRSIAHHLRQKSIQVSVLDINPGRQILAMAHGFHTETKAHLLTNADIVYCATGNHSLTHLDIPIIKRGAYVFTATSADDEIEDHTSLMQRAFHDKKYNISRIDTNGSYFYIANSGNSANFMHGGIVGPFIKLIQAELIFCLSQLNGAPTDRIIELSDTKKRFIADTWLEQFTSQPA
ncbi:MULTISPECIES: adenosylhomocysteinase [unclassified Cupriavidus]|uniref:adenosylhomocysteinase n=1 Tax=unclassified Cupriavidus TaxID=2640874 RepID=UPI000563115F|nr:MULTISPECIES: adenosylhomocysteinase [unclassified Cupriavidus]MBP0631060.1 NAD-binding protein [Cupriavidus sp. AcVe19-1a]